MKQQDKLSNYKHIIMISIDTLRADSIKSVAKSDFLSQFAPKEFNTNSLDQIIAKGTYFDYCITAAPYTTASHAAYFTGCWPKNNNVYEFYNRSISKPTIFEMMSKAGRNTIFQTDFPIILGNNIGFTKGVDNYFIENENAALKRLIELRQKSTLSFFHFGGVHYPYGFHKKKFAGNDYVSKIVSLEKKLGLSGKDLPEDILDESYRDDEERSLLLRYKKIIDELYKARNYDLLHELYTEGISYFMTHRFDPFIKRLTDFVDQEKALLIIFADHGEHWDDNSAGHSNSISHGVLHVPLIFYGDNIRQGLKIDSLVRTIDLAPTIAEICSLKYQFDGISLLPYLKGKKANSRTGLAQVWRTGNKQKIFSHQQKILHKNHMIKPLKTHLEKEAVYDGGNVLQRYHQLDKIRNELFSYHKSNDRLNPTMSQTAYDKLNHVLDKYNKDFGKQKGKKVTLTDKIAAELKSLGYRV